MSAKTSRIIRELTESVKKASTPRTQPYDTQATVTRIEDGVAWVHIPGGVPETPVKLTINAAVGDTVQVRVSGGRPFLVGNSTAPPTDDKLAKTVQKDLGVTNKLVSAVKKVAEKASKIATNMNQYFWVVESGTTDNGVHITQVPQEEFQADPENGGGNLLATSNGIAVRDGLAELSVFSRDGTDIYSYDGYDVAHMGYGTCQDSNGDPVRGLFFSFGPRNASSPVGGWSFAEGRVTTASGEGSHSEGGYTFAEGIDSHAEGYWSVASGHRSHAQNMYTVAAYNDQTAIGKYNDNQPDTAFEIGNGTSTASRSNALTVDWNGNLDIAGTYKKDGQDFIVVESKTLSSVTLSANGGTDTATGDVSKTGYTPICIVAISKSGSGSGQTALSGYYISGTTANVSYVNVSTAARTVGTTATVLYMKS